MNQGEKNNRIGRFGASTVPKASRRSGMQMITLPLGTVEARTTQSESEHQTTTAAPPRPRSNSGRHQTAATKQPTPKKKKAAGLFASHKTKTATQKRRGAATPQRGAGMGAQTPGTRQAGNQQPARHSASKMGGAGRMAPSTNPQQAGYIPGASRPRRRMTQVEKRRVRIRRRVIGALCVLGVLLLGVGLSMNLLFKVTGFELQNMDKSSPANTGIYTEQQIIDQLGVQQGDNLFGFSTHAKAKEILTALPYLDQAEIKTRLPGTVVVRIQAATERFKLKLGGQWVVLSDKLKVLRVLGDEPNGLILLDLLTDASQVPVVGNTISLYATESLSADETNVQDAVNTGETAQVSAVDSLNQLLDATEQYGLLEKIGVISLTDLSQINFLYDGRVSVKLGTLNNLDYKMRMASTIILDVDGKGLTATDRGTLDVSYQREDGDIYGYFSPASAATQEPEPQPTPAPEEGEEPDNAPAEGADGAEGDAVPNDEAAGQNAA